MTSLTFTNTLSASAKAATQGTGYQCTVIGDEVTDKKGERGRVEKEKYTHDGAESYVWFLGRALKWSSAAHSHHRGPQVNRSSHRSTKRKREMKREGEQKE